MGKICDITLNQYKTYETKKQVRKCIYTESTFQKISINIGIFFAQYWSLLKTLPTSQSCTVVSKTARHWPVKQLAHKPCRCDRYLRLFLYSSWFSFWVYVHACIGYIVQEFISQNSEKDNYISKTIFSSVIFSACWCFFMLGFCVLFCILLCS